MAKKSENYSASSQAHSQPRKLRISSVSNRLSPSEIEQLRQDLRTGLDQVRAAREKRQKATHSSTGPNN